MRKIFKKIIYILSRSNLLYITSKKIVDYRRNENNCEIETNGEFDFIYNNKDNFKVIFDVGANIGEWTELVSKTIPEAKIYSFEPSAQTFKTLSSKKFSNKVNLNNIGLGDKKEVKDFFIYGEDSTLNSAFNRDMKNTQIEKASFETLDDFCVKNNIDRVSFLKIDTEGNELSVLKGSEQYLKQGKIDTVQFEYGGTYIDANILLKDVFIFLKDKPYKIFKMMQNGLQECPAYSETLENYQYSNYIAVLKK
jgi:FkbM family methyltransferase